MAEEDDDEDVGDEDIGEEEVEEEELEEEDSSEEDDGGDDVPSVAAPVAPAAPPARGGRPVRPAAGGARRRVAAVPAAHRRRRSAAGPYVPALTGGGTGGRGRGRGRGADRGAGRGDGGGAGGARRNAAAPMAFQSYGNPDTPNVLPPFAPSRPVGIHFGRPHLRNTMTTALEFFSLFFTEEMVRDICTHTNTYANEQIVAGSHQSYTQSDGSWNDTTSEEIKRLIALLIYFGLVKVGGNTDKYWSTKTLYYGLWARSIMSRTRYRALMALLHVVDPGSENAGDKLCKVESFIDYFKSRCLALYQPRQQLAIDERMVKSRHQSGIRQYIKDKPTKWGIKLWVLADSSNGYTIDFNVYIGKAAGRDVSVNGLGYDVVVRLMHNFFNQGYHLYIDNFYTSTALVKYLFQQGVPTTGTIRENSRGFPANMKNGTQWSKASNVQRGSMRWERDPPVLALQWLDNKVVSMLTTIENANDSLQVKRKTKTAGVWSTKVVQQPQAIATYNKYMNAVDRSDQILAVNNVLRKCMRWWKTLFFHMIDIAVVNSFILFREHERKFPDNEDLKRTADYTLGNFREEIVRQICDFPEKADQPPGLSTPKAVDPNEFQSLHMPVFTDEKKNCVVCYKQNKVQRQVFSTCSAPMCEGKHMHVTKEKNCFQVFHSREYQH